MIASPNVVLYDSNGNPILGQAASAASFPVVVASDQKVPTTVNASGRVRCLIHFFDATPATGETLLTITKQLAGVYGTPATSIGVTAGKILRITSFMVSLRNAGAATHCAVRLRSNPAGATVLASPLSLVAYLGLTDAATGGSLSFTQTFPEGLEFSGTETVGISMNTPSTSNLVAIMMSGYEYTP